MKLQEIEAACKRFEVCPKCNTKRGFWLGLKSDRAYVQCKDCGAKFELYEIYKISEKSRTPQRFRFFRR